MAESSFAGEHAWTFFQGLGAHAIMPLGRSPSATFRLVLAILGYAAGWLLPRGGSQQIVNECYVPSRSRTCPPRGAPGRRTLWSKRLHCLQLRFNTRGSNG